MTDHATITNTRVSSRDVIINDTHRGLWYQDGQLVRVLTAGRYVIPGRGWLPLQRRKRVEIVLVDVRERELTIKGQEILTSDKVAIRVSIVVQFRVTDPAAALQRVAAYEDRLCSNRAPKPSGPRARHRPLWPSTPIRRPSRFATHR